ncbi:DNA polymerase (pol2) [Allomyces macrogynus ATCC 38327]|uniref:DNA polymerase n=1 Tax=Allomyces macrogynus (strain ATCC 38327) TaxID=578462 RepID=A0A0L0SX77_ALLM3|nr:DNA polymerase (pol2) [Allomyces macrogynus ATCC 38327]|eukprot:KNE67086.1 DNA polymerase (pol2) [Allomyces macrogynus ATCC 38327]
MSDRRSSRRSAAGGSRAEQLARLRDLRDVKDGVTTRKDQYRVNDDESATAIYDTVTDDEFRRLQRDRMKEDAFVVDDDGAGYGAPIESWEDGDRSDHDDDEDDAGSRRRTAHSKAGKGKSSTAAAAAPSKKRPREQHQAGIAEAFSKVERKAVKAPAVASAPKPTSKEETDFLSSLLAELEDDAVGHAGASASSSSTPRTTSARKKPRLLPPAPSSSLASSSYRASDTSSPFLSGPPPAAMPDMDDLLADATPMDIDDAEPMDVKPDLAMLDSVDSVRAGPSSADLSARVKIESDVINVGDSSPATAPAAAPPPVSSTATGLEVKAISTVKPKPRARTTIDLPAFVVPSSSSSAHPNASASTVTGPVPPQSVLESDGSLHFYYMDAAEHHGVVYLFGKVRHGATYVSCTLAVENIERNVFLLPRERRTRRDGTHATDELVAPMDVYAEFDQMRRPLRIAKFAAKFVDRKYAFEVPDVPAAASWMKIAYSFQDPPLPADLKGETFSHVFGTNTSALELLVIKRKLMGPAWLVVRDVAMQAPAFSWSKVEGTVTNPKSITVMKANGASPVPPAPPLTVMALSVKSALNAKGQQEVLTLTTQTYSLDDDGTQQNVQQLVLVRPPTLGTTIPPVGQDVRVHQQERSLLSQFMATVQVQDPDVLLGHNIAGFDLEVILSRFKHLNLGGWSKLGRLRRTQWPKATQFRTIVAGRLLLDTYLAAKEFIGSSKSYSLTHLAATKLGHTRPEFDVTAVRQQFAAPHLLQQLLAFTVEDCALAMALMKHLNAISLYKQLTNICGNLWSRTMIGGRAERNEYLLLHEFHAKKYIVPDKPGFGQHGGGGKGGNVQSAAPAPQAEPNADLDMDEAGEDGVVGHEQAAASGGTTTTSRNKRRKPQYAGGLVLEPKKGFYDKYVLLLDFNSLYPSIIQEYNICFTTVTRADSDSAVPPLPDLNAESVLPRLIKTLVDRRRQVKSLMKGKCTPAELAQYDIRQMALKLTANSMYGCLGFTFARFYCKPLAALITQQGREILQSTVDLASANHMHVIYGDTDSIMIDTSTDDLAQVKALGRQLKDLVNKRYRQLEIEMDGFFERMLLLKKKKYAALKVDENRDGSLTRKLETKGLDVVRRDWCGLSHVVSEYVLEQLLMQPISREQAVEAIHQYLATTADRVRAGEVAIDQFVINKGLTKPPREYTDSQPHVTVALAMEARGQPIHVGDTVPYVICAPVQGTAEAASGSQSLASRAHHPTDLTRDPALKADVEWYLAHQVLPPVIRLCAVIEGTDPARLAHCLGLDYRQYSLSTNESGRDDQGANDDVRPLESLLSDEERFAQADPLMLRCPRCAANAMDPDHAPAPFIVRAPVVPIDPTDPASGMQVGWTCPQCRTPIPAPSVAAQVLHQVRSHLYTAGSRWAACDDPSCQARSRAIRVYGGRCWNAPACGGRVHLVHGPQMLNRQLAFYAYLFDADRVLARKDSTEAARACVAGAQHEMRRIGEQVARYTRANARNQVDLASLFAFVRN